MRVHAYFLSLLLIAQQVFAQTDSNIQIASQIAAALPGIGVAGPVAGLLNNHLVVAGGANFPDAMPWKGGAKKYQDEIYIFQPSGNQLMMLNKQLVLPKPIAYAALCHIPEGILYAGGENAEGISKQTWLLQWDAIKQTIITKSFPDLPLPLTNAAAVCVNNQVYLMGGETVNETATSFFSLDLSNVKKGWQSLGMLPQPLSHLVLTVINKENTPSLYIMGGRQKNKNGISSFSNKTYRYHIKNNTWENLAEMPYALSAGTGVWWNKDQIVLLGGDRGIVFNQVEKLLVAIANENDAEKKQILINQKNQIQETHPGFSKEILLYAADTNQWKIVGSLNHEIPVTTTAFIWNSKLFIPSGEIKAGVRSPNILQITIQPPQP